MPDRHGLESLVRAAQRGAADVAKRMNKPSSTFASALFLRGENGVSVHGVVIAPDRESRATLFREVLPALIHDNRATAFALISETWSAPIERPPRGSHVRQGRRDGPARPSAFAFYFCPEPPRSNRPRCRYYRDGHCCRARIVVNGSARRGDHRRHDCRAPRPAVISLDAEVRAARIRALY